jgi:hypothetical protein
MPHLNSCAWPSAQTTSTSSSRWGYIRTSAAIRRPPTSQLSRAAAEPPRSTDAPPTRPPSACCCRWEAAGPASGVSSTWATLRGPAGEQPETWRAARWQSLLGGPQRQSRVPESRGHPRRAAGGCQNMPRPRRRLPLCLPAERCAAAPTSNSLSLRYVTAASSRAAGPPPSPASISSCLTCGSHRRLASGMDQGPAADKGAAAAAARAAWGRGARCMVCGGA